MKRLVVAACLALVAIGASAWPAGKQQVKSFTEIAVEHYLKLCEDEILEDWLSIPAPIALEYQSLHDQADECSWWIDNRDDHKRKFANCYKYGFDKMHKRIRENTSGIELRLYDRRMKGDKICNHLQEWVEEEFDNDWSEVPEDSPKPVDETLSVKTCADKFLSKNKDFKLPGLFGFLSDNIQRNLCEEAYERALKTGRRDCRSNYRMSDYLAIFSEEERKSYEEIKMGLETCEELLNLEWDWSEELEGNVREQTGDKNSGE